MAKLKDVAEKAKVSLATASLALNDSALISGKTKEKVMDWAEKLEYYPNINAQRLAKRKSYNICLMLNAKYFFKKSSNVYYLRVIGGLVKESESTEYSITFTFYNDQDAGNSGKFLFSRLNIKNFDGIIIFDVINTETFDLLKKKAKIPILLVDNHNNFPDIFAVDNDDFGGAYKATSYLIGLGHRKLGFLGIPQDHPFGRECLEGFNKALQDSGLKETLIYQKCGLGIRSGRNAIEEVFAGNNEIPTAFFCINDYIAIGAMEELKRRGYKIPGDFSLVGMDDMDISSEIDPPLTTVKIKMEMLGQVAIKKLISIIDGDYKGEVKTIVNNEIIERQSCRKVETL